MMTLLLLLLLLLLVLWLVYNTNGRDILSPDFIFTLSFILLVSGAIPYQKLWNLDLHYNTFLVIVLGILEFYIVGLFIRKSVNKNINIKKLEYCNVERYKDILFLIILIVVNILYINNIIKIVNGSLGNFSQISNYIATYNNLSKFTNQTVQLSSIISNMKIVVKAGSYWYLYVLINNYIVTNKFDKTKLVIVIVYFISTILSGGRNGAFDMLLATIFLFIFLKSRNNGILPKINFKLVRNIGILAILFLYLFTNSMTTLIGRNMEDYNNNKLYYLSIYCGAELKNLDSFLQEKENYKKKTEIWGGQTFFQLNNIRNKLSTNKYEPYQLDLPFRTVNGLDLGNVYTTFYAYIYDFGYWGEFFCVLIMAIISQLIYEKSKKVALLDKPRISILIYSYMFSSLLLSFFSNKFYENNINFTIIKMIIIWLLFNWFFGKLKIKYDGKEILKK